MCEYEDVIKGNCSQGKMDLDHIDKIKENLFNEEGDDSYKKIKEILWLYYYLINNEEEEFEKEVKEHLENLNKKKEEEEEGEEELLSNNERGSEVSSKSESILGSRSESRSRRSSDYGGYDSDNGSKSDNGERD